jgi:hypothetical protein
MFKLKLSLIIAAIGVLVDTTSRPLLARAHLSPSIQAASERPELPRRGIPDGRSPSGSRQGRCEDTVAPFTPLLPVSSSGFSSSTLTERPTFWFYIPYKPSSVSSGQFSLVDRQENEIYWIRFQLPRTPGFVGVNIPKTAKALEKNQEYRWYFQLDCASQASLPPEKVWYQGVVRRVDGMSLESRLKTARVEERINLYVQNSLWYDALSDLVQVHNLPQGWHNLLRAMGLEQLEQAPISGSVVPLEEQGAR